MGGACDALNSPLLLKMKWAAHLADDDILPGTDWFKRIDEQIKATYHRGQYADTRSGAITTRPSPAASPAAVPNIVAMIDLVLALRSSS